MIYYRRPLPEDFAQMVDLQNRNLISVLEPHQLTEGFLATAFTADQFQVMDKDVSVFVALENDVVCGYLCASPPEFNRPFPILGVMLAQCDSLFYQDKAIRDYRYCVVGPICIDAAYRGQAVFSQLANRFLEGVSSQYELIVTLISEKNSRSLRTAHKMGMEIIDRFEAAGGYFHILARRVIS
jgi:hypothetical protein